MTFTPTNEMGVMYLFSRHHERLGFEKIIQVQTQFPDITVLREGKEIAIELEFKLKSFDVHYLYRSDVDEGYWKWDDRYNVWRIYDPFKKDFVEVPEISLRMDDSARRKLDPRSAKFVAGNLNDNIHEINGMLYYKSLKDVCDCIVCWDEGKHKLKEDIEIIVLKDRKLG